MYDAIHFTRFASFARRKSQVSLADGHEPLHLSGRAISGGYRPTQRRGAHVDFKNLRQLFQHFPSVT
jgi:hypothetical protein